MSDSKYVMTVFRVILIISLIMVISISSFAFLPFSVTPSALLLLSLLYQPEYVIFFCCSAAVQIKSLFIKISGTVDAVEHSLIIETYT